MVNVWQFLVFELRKLRGIGHVLFCSCCCCFSICIICIILVFYMVWQIALHNIMWHWPSVTYFISRSLPDEALIIHCVFQQLLQHEVLFVMVFPEALPNDVKDAYASFGDMPAVQLKKKNDFNLIGAVPGRYMYQVFLSFPLLGSSVSHQAFHSTPSIT